jgi:hypothetical protein
MSLFQFSFFKCKDTKKQGIVHYFFRGRKWDIRVLLWDISVLIWDDFGHFAKSALYWRLSSRDKVDVKSSYKPIKNKKGESNNG